MQGEGEGREAGGRVRVMVHFGMHPWSTHWFDTPPTARELLVYLESNPCKQFGWRLEERRKHNPCSRLHARYRDKNFMERSDIAFLHVRYLDKNGRCIGDEARAVLDPEDDEDDNRIKTGAFVTLCTMAGLTVAVSHHTVRRLDNIFVPVEEARCSVGEFVRRASEQFGRSEYEQAAGGPFENVCEHDGYGRGEPINPALEVRRAFSDGDLVKAEPPVWTFEVDVRGRKLTGLKVPWTATVADMIKTVNDRVVAERLRGRPRVVELERIDGALLDKTQPVRGYVFWGDKFYAHTEHDDSMTVAPVTKTMYRGGCTWRPEPSALSVLASSVAGFVASLLAPAAPPRGHARSDGASTDTSPASSESSGLLSTTGGASKAKLE